MLLLLCFVLLVLFPSVSMAYIDPGTGSMIIQMIVAGLVAVGISGKVFWGRIKGLFNKKTADADEKLDQ